MRHAAPEPADQRLGQLHQPHREAGAVHDLAGEDEERHRQEGEEIEPGEEPVRRHGQEARTHLENADHAGDADYEADRKRRLGAKADQPHRIKYRPLTRG